MAFIENLFIKKTYHTVYAKKWHKFYWRNIISGFIKENAIQIKCKPYIIHCYEEGSSQKVAAETEGSGDDKVKTEADQGKVEL